MNSNKKDDGYQQVAVEESNHIQDEAAQSTVVIDPEIPQNPLEYGIEDNPPWGIVILYSLQQVSTVLVGPLTAVFVLQQCLCLDEANSGHIQARLLSTSMFMMGVATLLQCTWGSRLPVVQSSAMSILVPILAVMTTEEWKCPEPQMLSQNITIDNNTATAQISDEIWVVRLREISGCLMCTGVIQILLGLTGVVGIFMNFIGPLTMGPTISLLGLTLGPVLLKGAQQHWGVTWFTILQMVVYTLILGNIRVPCINFGLRTGFKVSYVKIFKLFPMLITIALSWMLCFILTRTGMLPVDPSESGYMTRIDAKLHVIEESSWVFVPYPGQWGMPAVSSFGAVVSLLTATIATTLDSLGDYYATAKVTQVKPPPKHAINRGIMVEGISCVLSGAIGAGHPTTSYSSSIGFIGLTGVASRRIWQVMSILCMLFGIFGKLGAVLVTIPGPIITGGAIVGISFVMASGLSMLQFVDLNSPRNLFIIGFAHMMGLMLPAWMTNNPAAINTGFPTFDKSVIVFLKTGMCVGGIIAMALDNILPGSKEERGMLAFQSGTKSAKNNKGLNEEKMNSNEQLTQETKSTYDIPFTRYLNKVACFRYVPFLPTYTEPGCCCKLRCGRKKK